MLAINIAVMNLNWFYEFSDTYNVNIGSKYDHYMRKNGFYFLRQNLRVLYMIGKKAIFRYPISR